MLIVTKRWTSQLSFKLVGGSVLLRPVFIVTYILSDSDRIQFVTLRGGERLLLYILLYTFRCTFWEQRESVT